MKTIKLACNLKENINTCDGCDTRVEWRAGYLLSLLSLLECDVAVCVNFINNEKLLYLKNDSEKRFYKYF